MNKEHLNSISSLKTLITECLNAKVFYEGILKLQIPELNDLIFPVYRQKNEYVNKLFNEIKRLGDKGISLTTRNNINSSYGSITDIIKQSIDIEKKLISEYIGILNKDILWEIIPVIARQLGFTEETKNRLMKFQQEELNELVSELESLSNAA